jgi:hypothetical protein
MWMVTGTVCDAYTMIRPMSEPRSPILVKKTKSGMASRIAGKR